MALWTTAAHAEDLVTLPTRPGVTLKLENNVVGPPTNLAITPGQHPAAMRGSTP